MGGLSRLTWRAKRPFDSGTKRAAENWETTRKTKESLKHFMTPCTDGRKNKPEGFGSGRNDGVGSKQASLSKKV